MSFRIDLGRAGRFSAGSGRIEAPSAWDSSVVTLFIVEALIAAVQNATWKENEQRMRTLEELFDQTKMFRKFI